MEVVNGVKRHLNIWVMANDTTICISSTSVSQSILQKAKSLAKNLSLPLSSDDTEDFNYLLVCTEHGLELQANSPEKGGIRENPLIVDFVGGANRYRYEKNSTINQPIARAVGIKSGFRPTIVDGTAGLGGDSFVFASLGCTVTMCERSPIIAALLEDGLNRALAGDERIAKIMSHMKLLQGDTCALLSQLEAKPYTVYLDPMYPHSTKSALNKKEMRYLRDLVGDDDDSSIMLQCALTNCTNRVVVKRPKGAPCVKGPKPSHEIRMKNSRFDVYLVSL